MENQNPNRNKNDNSFSEQTVSMSIQFNPQWITEEADEQMIKYAEELGKKLKNNKLSNSQIRNFYDEIKRIQMGGFTKHKGEFLLLKPKVAYAAGRALKQNPNLQGHKLFKQEFNKAVSVVNTERDFINFCHFMEAILAYHTYYDAENKKGQIGKY